MQVKKPHSDKRTSRDLAPGAFSFPQMAAVYPCRCYWNGEPRRARALVIARMPENMFDGSFGFGVDEGVLVLTHLVWVGTFLPARPLCNLSVIRAESCLFGRNWCTHHRRHQD